MKRKVYIVCALLFCLLLYGSFFLYKASFNESYVESAFIQSQRKLTLFSSRGIIYDRNLSPVTNESEKLYAIIPPDASTLISVKDDIKEEFDAEELIKSGKPVLLETEKITENEKVENISISERYSKNQTASNIIGYTDSNGAVCGMEKYADDILTKHGGSLSFIYTADSLGRMIIGSDTETENALNKKGGIVLTIDKKLQEYAESRGKEIENGAIVVLNVPDGKILAAASFPLFDSSAPYEFIGSENSPFMDKCLCAFAPGSVFKTIITAAALSENCNYSKFYPCSGVTYTEDMAFSCYNKLPHGDTDLNLAFALSCNCYYINLSKKLSIGNMVATAYNFGLGSKTRLYPGFYSESGNIPDEKELVSSRALSNFAIGQGTVSITPLQAAAMMNTIASHGIYTEPSLYEGETYDGENIIRDNNKKGSVSVCKVSHSFLIENYMASAVKSGTAKKGDSEYYKAFAKTGTAQTGKWENGSELLNYWYAGFIETQDNKRYVITVLSAYSTEGNNPTGEIFKDIGEFIALNKI